ncbi:MAG: FlgD immunoglobulin-like domain containing protein [Candidatus Cloacimonadota bacterium]|nr:FlgD immunoglobulin-like domain containing protein [Candidatus Cloacimonadota bacterium]
MKKNMLFIFIFLFILTIINAQNVNGDTLSVEGKKILKVWGTHYERGYATGYLFGDKIKEISESYFIYAFFGGNSYLYESTRTYFLDNFQIEEKYISETEGMIDGMIEADINLFSDILDRDIDANDLLLSNAIVDLAALGDLNLNYQFGCSSLSSWGESTILDPELSGNLVITRNMDWTPHPALLENHLLIVHFPSEADEVNWLSFTFPGLIGGLSSINENGLCAFMNMGNHNEHPNTYTFHPIFLSIRNGIEVYDYDGDYEIAPEDVQAAIEENYQLSGSIVHTANHESGLIIECNNQNGIVVRDDNDNTIIPMEHLVATNHFRELYPPVGCYRYNNIADSLSTSSDIDIIRSWDILAGAAGVSHNIHTIQYAPSLNLIKWSTAMVGTPAYQLEPTILDAEELFTYNTSANTFYFQDHSFLTVSPNPFYSSTNLSFSLTKTTDVKLCIYNIKGHKIRTLLSDVLVQGSHNVSWDGTDENGKKISSGIYFYTLETINDIYTKKVILLK